MLKPRDLNIKAKISFYLKNGTFFLKFIKMNAPSDIPLTASDLSAFYATYFKYYATLDTEHQGLFVSRCLRFIDDKNITGAEGFTVTNQVKAILAASAVQLTLGLQTWDLDYFETIVVHPSDFDNKASGLKYSGETNMAGVVKLSWKKFIRGYAVPDDNLNLGLHEFSHALRFNSIRGNGQDYFIEYYFNSWLASAYEAFYDLKKEKSAVFRQYGGANMNEFVSVCIEHYFESPLAIREHYPALYYSTAILLNQQTNGKTTRVNIRHEMLEEKNKLLPGIRYYRFHSTLLKPPMLVAAVALVLSVYFGGWVTITLFILLVLLFLYLRADYKYAVCRLQQNRLAIARGFLFFKWRKEKTLLLANLVSVRAAGDPATARNWEFIYYDPSGGFFYEEKLRAEKMNNAEFIKDLIANKIASLK